MKKPRTHQIRGENGADNGTRTRGLNLGKVALYQLSYVRNAERLKSVPYLFSAWQVPENIPACSPISVQPRTEGPRTEVPHT